MSQITWRAIAAKSSTALVVISPASTTRPVVSSVSTATRDSRVLGQRGVHDRVGDLVGHLVRMALGHGFGGEEEFVVGPLMACLLPVCGDWVIWSGQLGSDAAATPATMARSFCLATSGARCRSPQSGLIIRRSAGTYVQRAPDPRRDQLGRLDLGALDVDHAQAEPLVPAVLLDQPQVVEALAGELEDELVDARVHHRREQEVVVPLPGRARVPVAVAHVQRPGDRHVLGHDVDRLDRQLDLLRVAGQERLVDLQQVGAGRGQLLRLGVEPAGQRADQVARLGVGLVADPPGQRERPGEGELDRPVGELAGEPEVVGQAETARLVSVRRAVRAAGG